MNEILMFIKEELGNDSSGHSIDHALRVQRLAKKIQETEGGNIRIINVGALVHDIIDPKLFHDVEAQKKKLEMFLREQSYISTEIEQIFDIIETISYNGGHQAQLNSIEAQIVQDADRLDAIGAIGVGRTFMYGGARGSKMYDESIDVQEFESVEAYRKHQSTVIHHFYEKLFKLKELINTETAKQMAQKRHDFMQTFVDQFLDEWHGMC